MDYLRGIATFVSAARVGNFTATARKLELTPQAVSSHVLQLEAWLGVRLFNRTTRKITLTAEGAALFEHCSKGLDSIEEGVRALRELNEDASGTVRLAVPYGLSQALVAPLLHRFLEKHPAISIDLIVGNDVPDAISQGIDVGIIGGAVPMASLVARRITSFHLVLCASTEYLQTHGTPQRVEDLKLHRCVNLRSPRTGKNLPWVFQQGQEVITLDVSAGLTANDTESHRRAVLSGAGIGQLASFFAAPYVLAKQLKPLLLGHIAAPIDLFLYLPHRINLPKKNRLLADFLVEELRNHPDLKPWPQLMRRIRPTS
jgi:DNA-binding transcriptional LysR family regulator